MTLSSASLLPFAEVRRTLGLVDQSYVGVRPIPVDRILGSLDRTVDFDRDFRPRSSHLESRLRSLREAYPAGDFPPITVYEVGGAYFVVDGHHRVALSRELGQTFIDADVVRLATEYDLDPSVDVLTLVHTQQHQRFMEESGLRSEEHTSELQSRPHLVCRLLLEKKKKKKVSVITLPKEQIL